LQQPVRRGGRPPKRAGGGLDGGENALAFAAAAQGMGGLHGSWLDGGGGGGGA
jgi:hypothetical protein